MTPIDDFSRDDFDTPIADDVPGAVVLGNGHYAVLVTDAGTGYSALDELALTRWFPDRTSDTLGFFLYVRDDEGGDWWSNGAQPSRRMPKKYRARVTPGVVRLRRRDDVIDTITEICVAPEEDVELRRITFINLGDRDRRLEITSYAEAVLNSPAGDAGHPAFSKLFVQTERTADGEGLLARRRPRSPDDVPLWLEHRLWTPDAWTVGEVEVETDRARFIGRGRSHTNPRAMDRGRALSGTVGNVLDPILSIRRGIVVPARQSVTVVAMLAAAPTREGVEAIAARYGTGHPTHAVDAAFDAARAADADVPEEMQTLAAGVPRWTAAPHGPRRTAQHLSAPRADDLVSWNGHGAFARDGTEYVIPLCAGEGGLDLPPLPWTNVIANERIGFIASERGAMSTWAENSRKNRLTPWYNDPVSDPHGEALYVRDDDTGDAWSPTPGPIVGDGSYEVRHGFGYTRWLHVHGALEEETIAFVPRHDPVKLIRVRITNHGDSQRALSVSYYAHLVLGVLPWETAPYVKTTEKNGVIRATNDTNDEFAANVAFATVVAPHAESVSFTTDRAAFLGIGREPDDPVGVRTPPGYVPDTSRISQHSGTPLDGTAPVAPSAPAPGPGGEPRPDPGHIRDISGTVSGVTSGLDPCAAIQARLTIRPHDSIECTFLLGEGANDDEVDRIVAKYRDPRTVDAALAAVRAFWLDLVSGVQIATPSPAIDLMVNGWLTYQNLSCRMFGRTAFYQSGGAFGFRDQLQDAAALIYLDPRRTRDQIVLHAGHQFVEGDVLHWWHPPTSGGIRTHFSDDLLWLPYVTAFYVNTTGDATVLDEVTPFLTAPPLPPGEDELFVVPEPSGTSATVYDHCVLTIERSLATGAHGLPLMGTGDWNDGMNRVGREGRGESVWLGFFLVHILKQFIPICEARGDHARANVYRDHATALSAALNDTGWDGDWYRRAYYDDGTPLGSKTGDECRIDAIAQAWSVIAAVATPGRARDALDAMESHLVSDDDGIIRLLTPAFDKTPHDPGYIKGYLPGVRENGGQYTHGALWAVRALAETGRCGRAAPLLEMLSPVTHARDARGVSRYQVEPYVIAADVYGVEPHVGRGGWTWYTGSAGWMFRVAIESILGVEIVRGDTLILRPCIPDWWPGFSLRYRLPGTRTVYELDVTRGNGDACATVDAGPQLLVSDGALRIPLVNDGATHLVRITLGGGIVPRFDAAVKTSVGTNQPPSDAP